MRCLMSRNGNCWDNAHTESWFNSLKNERVHGAKYKNLEKIKATGFEHIEVFYNHKHQRSTLGFHPPVEFIECWQISQELHQQDA